jgi:hypothetical protein
MVYPWRKTFLVALLFLACLSCGSNKDPASVMEQQPTEETRPGSYTLFTELPAPDKNIPEEKTQASPGAPPASEPSARIKKRYPPPMAPAAPMAPRGPPVPPRYSVEPPPSKVKAFPDFKVESLGIWECDNYTTQYLVCINQRVPRNEDTKLAKALSLKVEEWKKKTGTETGRGELAQECLATFKRTKKAMQPYLCIWH